jgi:hypothetical protein
MITGKDCIWKYSGPIFKMCIPPYSRGGTVVKVEKHLALLPLQRFISQPFTPTIIVKYSYNCAFTAPQEFSEPAVALTWTTVDKL